MMTHLDEMFGITTILVWVVLFTLASVLNRLNRYLKIREKNHGH